MFLGGTCNQSNWRDKLIPLLAIDYFNPVVKDWTPECQANELYQRKICDWVLYVITPRMIGCYSIAEAVDDSNKRPGNVVFAVLTKEGSVTFDEWAMRSFNAVADMIARNGGVCFLSTGNDDETLQRIADFINHGC